MKKISVWILILLLCVSPFILLGKSTIFLETVNCDPLSANQLTVDNILETSATIYTAQPYGQVNNIFRYKITSSADWITLLSSTSSSQNLIGLSFGQTYEFQVNHECNEGQWTGFSASQTFKTFGFVTCAAIFFADNDMDGLGDPNNSISGCFAPLGFVSNFDDCDDTNPNIPAMAGSACDGGIIAEDGCTCNAIDESENTEDTDETINSENEDALIDGTKMSTSSISEHNTYIYTLQPHGLVGNQFRYRPIGTVEWQKTEISTSYYRYLKDLLAGTEYEFQVRHERPDGAFYNFSASSNFTTIGTPQSDDQTIVCDKVSISGLFVSSVSVFAAYIYTSQPLGSTNNQFRYRPVGSSEWLLTDISTLYYRYLIDLLPGSRYEYQVRQECEIGNWSTYSDSFEFTTLKN